MAARVSLWAAGACAVVTILAGCSEAETPKPTVVTTVSPTSQPTITRPLDAARYFNKDKICELLTNQQAERLGVRDNDSPLAISGRNLSSCSRSYVDDSTVSRVDTNLFPVDWLDDQNKPSQDETSTWITISGQPAVAHKSSKTPSSCRVVIGLTEQQSAVVFISDVSPHPRDACELAVSVGLEIVQNLS